MLLAKNFKYLSTLKKVHSAKNFPQQDSMWLPWGDNESPGGGGRLLATSSHFVRKLEFLFEIALGLRSSLRGAPFQETI